MPLADLIARVTSATPRKIVDLGCGPGNSTHLLNKTFPEARIIGLDSSADMVAKARESYTELAFDVTDATHWNPEADTDLVFSNAMFQWLPDHPNHVSRIFRALRPGAWMAVQMPDNLSEPSHIGMVEVASQPAWRGKLSKAENQRSVVLPASQYHSMLSPLAKELQIWRTVYYHHLRSHQSIIDLFSSTGLRPFLHPLPPHEQNAYLKSYAEFLKAHYPAQADGSVLLPLPRLFIVAIRADT